MISYTQAYTFVNPFCQRFSQSLQKSMLFPTLIKNKKSPLLKKNKTLPTHNPTDRNEMTILTDIQKCMSLDKKDGQLLTAA
jgi:hypothetical protein